MYQHYALSSALSSYALTDLCISDPHQGQVPLGGGRRRVARQGAPGDSLGIVRAGTLTSPCCAKITFDTLIFRCSYSTRSPVS